MDDYDIICQRLVELLSFKNQLETIAQELSSLKNDKMPVPENQTLSWEEAVQFAKNKQKRAEKIDSLKKGVSNREEFIKLKKKEIAALMPIENHFIEFHIKLNEEALSYRIAYFTESNELKIEPMNTAENKEESQ